MSFRERLDFDDANGEYRDGAIRYMMIRPDALMGILAELPDALRPQVLEAFARSITRAGGNSARTYQKAGAAAPEQLVATIAATAPELGWGIWTLTLGDGRLDLEVRNSPFAAGIGTSADPVCHPIKGMLAAIGPMILGCNVQVIETRCAAQGHPTCRFEVTALAA